MNYIANPPKKPRFFSAKRRASAALKKAAMALVADTITPAEVAKWGAIFISGVRDCSKDQTLESRAIVEAALELVEEAMNPSQEDRIKALARLMMRLKPLADLSGKPGFPSSPDTAGEPGITGPGNRGRGPSVRPDTGSR